MTKQQKPIFCKSVFKSGENTEMIKTQFTKKWVELINQIEKNKIHKAGKLI